MPLMNQILEYPNKNKLMVELFPEGDDKEYQQISQDVKNKTILELIQFSSSQTQYSASRVTITQLLDTHIVDVDQNFLQQINEVKKQVIQNVINCFSVLTTSAFIFNQGRPHGKTNVRNETSPLYYKSA